MNNCLLPKAGFSPCFPVTDMRAALAHYEQLGFEVMAWEEGAEWGWVRFGAAELHLYVKQDHDPARTAAAADLAVEDCEALLKHAGARRACRAPATRMTLPTGTARPCTSTLITT